MSAPARPTGHDEYEALAVAWAIDALEPADQAEFEAHREGCDRCAHTVAAALRIAAELAYGVPDIDPPPLLRARVLALATPRTPTPDRTPEDTTDQPEAGHRAAPDGAALDGGDPDAGDPDAGLGRLGAPRDGRRISRLGTPHDNGPTNRPGAPHDNGPTNQPGAPHDDVPTDQPGAPHDNGPADQPGTQHYGGPTDQPGTQHDGGLTYEPGGPRDSSRTDRRRKGGGTHRSTSRRTAGGRARPGPAERVDAGGPAGRGAGPWVRGRRRALSVLAAVVLVGLSAVTTWEVTRPAPTAAPAAAADRVATLTTQAGNRTLGTLVATGGGANLVTDGLAPNAGRGTDYVVWGVPAGESGTPQVVGRVTVTAEGLHSYPVRLTRPLDDYPVVAISEEAAGSTPTAPSRILGRGPLGR